MGKNINTIVRLKAYFDNITEPIPDGFRHNTFNTHVFNAASAIPEVSERDLLLEANRLNERLCIPPLPPCDVANIIASVIKADKPVRTSKVSTSNCYRRNMAKSKTAVETKPKKVCAETRTITYDYLDYDGNIAYRKKRIEVTGKEKTFRFEPTGIKQHYPFNFSSL